MKEGMLFTIEPILVEGSTEAEVWKDGWTYVTKDKGRTAQCEHMILITKDGNEILTLPDDSF
jgi:methionyl aminopeptidase